MLSAILRSDVAIRVSIGIMRAFVEMRHFIANNSLLFEKVSNLELKQLEYQKSTDERFDKVFRYIDDHTESEQKIFFDGQIAYHIGASIKDAGKKCFGITMLSDPEMVSELLTRLNGI